jgi:hypothetical protein
MDLSAAIWRKSTRSQGGGENCVEVAAIARAVAIRDSKDPYGPVYVMRSDAFRALVGRIKTGGLDL